MTHGTSHAPVQPSLATEPWPDGVIARYLTVGGATVDLTRDGDSDRVYRHCLGCGDGNGIWWSEQTSRDYAQKHAEKCRAMPAPASGQTSSAQPGDPGYDHTKASWYSKNAREMTDTEVDEARAYYDSIGSTSMESEWLRRHGLPEDYGDPA